MILPQSSSLVLILMSLSLLCLATWPSLLKAGGKLRFELFYFDFAFGILIAILLCSFTFGDLGYDGFSFLDDLQHAGKRQWLFCVLAGIIFNLGNMLMLGAISISGISIAMPISVGVSILLSAALGVLIKGGSNGPLLLIGCSLILTAVVVGAMAYRITGLQKHEQQARAGLAKSTRRPNPMKGIILAVAGGVFMGLIGGLLARSRDGDIGLGPYSAAALFGGGVFFSTFAYNIFFLNLPVEGQPLELGSYLQVHFPQHIAGWIGGVIWYLGVVAGMVGTAVPQAIQPAPLLRFLFAYGAPVVAAIIGILVWRELKESDVRVRILAGLMLALFACGLAMIGLSPVDVARG